MTLGNRHHGEHNGCEVVDVRLMRPSLFTRDRCPTIPTLCDFVMTAGYPKPSEVKRVEHFDEPHTRIYRLYIKRDPCPVMLLPGQAVCPICGESHE